MSPEKIDKEHTFKKKLIELEKSNCRKKIYEEKISRSRKTKL